MKLSFVLVVIFYADHILPTDGRCTSGEIFPDSSDETCKKYFVCKKGQLVKQTCFRDFVYSKTINTCVPPSSSYNDCQATTRMMTEITSAVEYSTRTTKRPFYVKDITKKTTKRTPGTFLEAVEYATRTTKRPSYVKDITKKPTKRTPDITKKTTKRTPAVEYATRTTKRPSYVKAVEYATRTTKRPSYVKDITKKTTKRTPGVKYITKTTKSPYYPEVKSATRTTKATSYQSCKNGETSPNTYDCKSYYVCSYNRLILISCPRNYVYSKLAGKCVLSHSPNDSC